MRIGLTVAGCIGALICPPWFAALCMVLLAVRYRAGEAILIGLLMDLTWQPYSDSLAGFLHAVPLFTLAAIFVVWALEPVRAQFLN